jgi:hypothetical protein
MSRSKNPPTLVQPTDLVMPKDLERRVLRAIRTGKMCRATVRHANGAVLDWMYISGAAIGEEGDMVFPSSFHANETTEEQAVEAGEKIKAGDVVASEFCIPAARRVRNAQQNVVN